MAFRVINVRPRANRAFCFLRDFPEEVGLNRYKFGAGEAFGADYPSDASIRMSPRERGMELPSLIGNTRSLLIVDAALREAFQAKNDGDTEYLPFTLINHKGRVASDEYTLVHPIGAKDCLDREASEIVLHEGKVVKVKTPVLDASKIDELPGLFRIMDDSYKYVVRDALWEALVALEPAPTNLFSTPLAVAGG